MLLIVGIRSGRHVVNGLHFRHFSDKHHMGAEVDRAGHFYADIGIRAVGHCKSAIVHSFALLIVAEFIHFMTRLESEMFEEGEISFWLMIEAVKILDFSISSQVSSSFDRLTQTCTGEEVTCAKVLEIQPLSRSSHFVVMTNNP